MANYGFIIDNRRCIGCHACTVACKSEHEVPVGVNRTWVKYIEKGQFPQSRRLFSVMRCNHCDAAPCIEICPVTALFRRPDGIVDFDNRRCIGCKACMQACPYDALYIDPDKHTAAKCNYCAHRIDIGLEPACVNVCPTQAIISGDLDDPDSRISITKSREAVTARKTEKGTQPALFYIEGDSASLEPMETEAIGTSMWGNQVQGVGHFARQLSGNAKQFAGDDGAGSETEHPLNQMHRLLDLGDKSDGVLVPDPDDADQRAKAEQVKTELARRTYDSPTKGTLWGWQVTSYVWTKAISAGTAMLSSAAVAFGLAEPSAVVQWAAVILALIFLGLTGVLLTMDLDQPKRFLNVMFRPQWRSWLVRGAYIITTFGALLTLWCALSILGATSLANALQWLVLIASILTAVYTAFLLAQAKGRDFWQSPLLGLHMLVHSIVAGAAVFGLVFPAYGESAWSQVILIGLAGGLALKLLIDWFELSMTHMSEDAKRTAHLITRGRYSKLYWIGVVAIGAATPIVMAVSGIAWLVPIASLMALVGLYVAEHIWIRAPQQIPLS